jgi:hypothetical protein
MCLCQRCIGGSTPPKGNVISSEFKILTVYFPNTGKSRELTFPRYQYQLVSTIYRFLMRNNGLIVDQDGFESWEIDLLAHSKSASGESLYQPDYFSKRPTE